MVGSFHIPPVGYGPGSQPEDTGDKLEYMQMPQDMRSYTTHIPEIEADENYAPALTVLRDIAKASDKVGRGAENVKFDLSGLDKPNRALIAETMGEGEVSVKIHDVPAVAAQESVFAGIWVLRGANIDVIEVGPVPQGALDRAFVPRKEGKGTKAPKVPGVVNAPPIYVELADKSAGFSSDDEAHVVNLTLLPHTEQDLEWLDAAMGKGAVDILSRGYGNCRVSATALPHIWRVQFFNSMDTLILDTFEVTSMPEVAIAAPEDLVDSGERLVEVLEAIR
ncbi:HupH hydrogenase expression protein [Actibacterium atlanticum]|uniref:HupH hydrogenase expression protein n=1 Tax=Actibacterium atlanticum TaxID=1461693 RepID=A0A058ZKH3_9RHOB|nr:hydrogenase expression/formation protein [Actibacterium atlanticum]KCV81286.1 HupH hydrogenase expression protein [Actibacterium atlanticum]